MANFYIERAYIEPYNEDEESHQILFHVKHGNDHIFIGKIELTRDIPWILLDTAENGDLIINNSAGMEANKWDHITKYILGEANGK
jgi:hypothetical protein